MTVNDVLINKAATIQRCIVRINEVYLQINRDLKNYVTEQDSIVLNLQRACEASIDLANIVIRAKKLGIPQSSRDSFKILNANNVIDESLTKNLQNMVSLRNIAVHDYQELNLDIVQYVVEQRLNDFDLFIASVKAALN